MGPIARARAKGLQNLTLKIFKERLEPNEARQVSCFGLHDDSTCIERNLLVLCVIEKGTSTKYVQGLKHDICGATVPNKGEEYGS